MAKSKKTKVIKKKLTSKKRKPARTKKVTKSKPVRKLKSSKIKKTKILMTKSKTKQMKKKVKPVKAKSLKVKTKSLKVKTKSLKVKTKATKSVNRNENKVVVETRIAVPVKKLKRYKPNKKVRYSKAELKHFREIILDERKAIFESAKANMEALVDKDSGEYKGDNLTYSSHMAEQGTDEMEREKNYLFVQRDEKYLGYLQEALMRIDQGTYGICIDCKDDPKNLCRTCPLVVKERLELVPITQHCIECKNLRG